MTGPKLCRWLGCCQIVHFMVQLSVLRRVLQMPENTYSISEISEQITRLPDYFERKPEVVIVTQHGKPVMAILPWALYESYQILLNSD